MARLTDAEKYMGRVMFMALPKERKRFLAAVLDKAMGVEQHRPGTQEAHYCREVIHAIWRDCRVYPTAEQAMSVADLYHRSERQSRELPRNRIKFN